MDIWTMSVANVQGTAAILKFLQLKNTLILAIIFFSFVKICQFEAVIIMHFLW